MTSKGEAWKRLSISNNKYREGWDRVYGEQKLPVNMEFVCHHCHKKWVTSTDGIPEIVKCLSCGKTIAIKR